MGPTPRVNCEGSPAPIMHEDAVLKCLLEARLRLSASLWAVLADAHSVEDIFQVTLVRAIKEAPNLRDPDHALAWARVTSRRLAIDHIRKYRSRMVLLDEAVLEKLDEQTDSSAEDTMQSKLNALKHCLSRLPEKSRRLMELRYQQNMDGKSLESLLGMKPNAIYQAIHRIHLALRKCVERRETAL